MHYSSYIQTVLGKLEPGELGFCQCHEHLFIASGTQDKIDSALRLDDPQKTMKELLLYKGLGGISVVDAQPVGCGRRARELVDVSKRTGINIIASTGFHKPLFYEGDHWLNIIDEDRFTEILIDDLTVGMYVDADFSFPQKVIPSKAGIIKTAVDEHGMTEKTKKLLKSAVEAAKITKTAIMCHTEHGLYALDLINYLVKKGIDTENIIVCHLDRDMGDMKYHREVAETGVYLECDTIGRFKYHSDYEEAKYIIQLVEWGFEDKVLLSLDGTNRRYKSYGGSIGLGYIIEKFIPLLLNLGLSQQVVDKMMVENPAKSLCKF